MEAIRIICNYCLVRLHTYIYLEGLAGRGAQPSDPARALPPRARIGTAHVSCWSNHVCVDKSVRYDEAHSISKNYNMQQHMRRHRYDAMGWQLSLILLSLVLRMRAHYATIALEELMSA